VCREVAYGRVILLATFGLDAYLYEALRAGVNAFPLKDSRPEDLLSGSQACSPGSAPETAHEQSSARSRARQVMSPSGAPLRRLEDVSGNLRCGVEPTVHTDRLSDDSHNASVALGSCRGALRNAGSAQRVAQALQIGTDHLNPVAPTDISRITSGVHRSPSTRDRSRWGSSWRGESRVGNFFGRVGGQLVRMLYLGSLIWRGSRRRRPVLSLFVPRARFGCPVRSGYSLRPLPDTDAALSRPPGGSEQGGLT
jgi:hypothetical protein